MNEIAIEQKLRVIDLRLEGIEVQLKIKKQAALEKPVQESEPSEKAISGDLLGIVSSICFILAAGLIIKLSFDTGWLTHEKQFGLATLLGLGLFAAGNFISNKDNLYARFLPAAGSTILYLTCFAAYQYYYLITFQTVIALTCLITALTLWFYVQFKHDIYAIVVAIGAYSEPLMTNVDHNAIFSLYYFVICSLTFTTLSIWVESRTLTVISSYLAIAITAYVGINLNMNVTIAAVLILHFVIFSIGTYTYSQLTKKTLSQRESWSLFPVLLIFYTGEYYFIDKIDPLFAPLVSIAAAIFLVILNRAAQKRSQLNTIDSSGVIIAFVTLVCFHSIYLELFPSDLKPWLFVIIMLAYSLYRDQLIAREFNYVSFIPLVAVSSILGIEYLNMLIHLVLPVNWNWTLVTWASFAAICLAIFKHHKYLNQNKNYIYTALATAQLLGIMGLYQLTMNLGTLAISVSWLLYALIVLAISQIRKDLVMAKSIFIVLAFAAGKVLIYDAASTPSLIRALSLVLTGIVLYASGYTIRQMSQNK